MFNIGGPSTGSSSFSSLVGIGSSMQLDSLEALTIFMNVSRDTGFKKCVSPLILSPGILDCCYSPQLGWKNRFSLTVHLDMPG